MLHYRNIDVPPGSEPVRPFDFLATPGKRRSFTPEQKARIIAESFVNGETVCAVARRHHLPVSQLFAWRKIARRLRDVDAAEVSFTPEPTDRTPGLQGSGRNGSERQVAPLEITIGSAVIRVPQGVDAATLKLVLEVLRAA